MISIFQTPGVNYPAVWVVKSTILYFIFNHVCTHFCVPPQLKVKPHIPTFYSILFFLLTLTRLKSGQAVLHFMIDCHFLNKTSFLYRNVCCIIYICNRSIPIDNIIVSVPVEKKNTSSYWGGCIGRSLATFLSHSLAALDAAELEVRLEVTVLIQGSPTTWYCEWSAIGFYFLRLVTTVVVGCGDGSYTPNKPLGDPLPFLA